MQMASPNGNNANAKKDRNNGYDQLVIEGQIELLNRRIAEQEAQYFAQETNFKLASAMMQTEKGSEFQEMKTLASRSKNNMTQIKKVTDNLIKIRDELEASFEPAAEEAATK
jgi:hypothetical protein